METEDKRALQEGLVVAAVAALVRGAVLLWVVQEAVPVADGLYYHRLASRLAEGAGYTWPWPDGVVTPAAHYPVGYPFLLSLVYRVTGPQAAAGALLNWALGVAGVAAVQAMVRRFAGRRAGLAAGLLAALDPATVLYTPALMTEGVTASLTAVAVWLVGVASTAE
ncbi:MAG: glycosyltransferase family 39 protein, partial [Polyangiaceae bacterium]|nr:glycosyltransferase family 39 protein [Polyangiaceae bacterium]